MKAVVFLADGFEECEALIVVDLLRRAGVETIMASTMMRLDVSSSRQIQIMADELVEDVDWKNVDLIVLPGGRIGTENLRKNKLVLGKCVEFASNRNIAAICAAPSILADLGLLDGKRATCHPDYEGQMTSAILTEESVTVDGNIVTGQGLGATFAFAFVLIEALVGFEKAEKIKREICYVEIPLDDKAIMN